MSTIAGIRAHSLADLYRRRSASLFSNVSLATLYGGNCTFCLQRSVTFVSARSFCNLRCEYGNGEVADCVVVGAGICGLAAALELTSKYGDIARNVIVTEAEGRVGGNILSVQRDGYLWEEGPNTFQPSDHLLKLAVDCGLKDDLLFADPNAPRYVLWDGKLRRLPSKFTDLPFFDLMSFHGKCRALIGACGFRPPPPGHEESIEQFTRRNFGDEVFERLFEPFCSGVFAGDASKLSMKAGFESVWKLEQNVSSIFGGILRAIKERKRIPESHQELRSLKPKGQTVGSFRGGLGMLPKAISKKISSKLKLRWKLLNITKVENGLYGLTYETPEGLISLHSRSLIMTVPSHGVKDILLPLCNAAADALAKVYYPPVAIVAISYPKGAIREELLVNDELKGFGQLHPRKHGLQTLGTIYASSLFPNRAPPGRVLLMNFVGGSTNSEILSKREGELVEVVDRDLKSVLIDPGAEDPLVLGVRIWPQAIPQFTVGYLDVVDDAVAALENAGLRGIFLGGSYVYGVALGRCVEGAYETAAKVASFLSQSRSRA